MCIFLNYFDWTGAVGSGGLEKAKEEIENILEEDIANSIDLKKIISSTINFTK